MYIYKYRQSIWIAIQQNKMPIGIWLWYLKKKNYIQTLSRLKNNERLKSWRHIYPIMSISWCWVKSRWYISIRHRNRSSDTCQRSTLSIENKWQRVPKDTRRRSYGPEEANTFVSVQVTRHLCPPCVRSCHIIFIAFCGKSGIILA